MLKSIRFLMITSLIYAGVCNESLHAADAGRLSLYRVSVPKSELKPNDNGGLLQYLLTAKDKCTVESLGIVPITNGSFALDTTSEIHFLSPQTDKSFTVQTAEKKIGFTFSGTLEKIGSQSVFSFKVTNTFIMKRIKLPGALDIAGGKPDFDTFMAESKTTLKPNIPVELCSLPTATPDVTDSSLYVLYSE